MVRECPNGTRDKFQCIVSLVPVCVPIRISCLADVQEGEFG